MIKLDDSGDIYYFGTVTCYEELFAFDAEAQGVKCIAFDKSKFGSGIWAFEYDPETKQWSKESVYKGSLQ